MDTGLALGFGGRGVDVGEEVGLVGWRRYLLSPSGLDGDLANVRDRVLSLVHRGVLVGLASSGRACLFLTCCILDVDLLLLAGAASR